MNTRLAQSLRISETPSYLRGLLRVIQHPDHHYHSGIEVFMPDTQAFEYFTYAEFTTALAEAVTIKSVSKGARSLHRGLRWSPRSA